MKFIFSSEGWLDRYLKCIHSLYPEALTKFNTTPGVRGEEEYRIRNKNLTMRMIIIWKTFRGGADLIADEAENGASGTIYEDQWISFLRESP